MIKNDAATDNANGQPGLGHRSSDADHPHVRYRGHRDAEPRRRGSGDGRHIPGERGRRARHGADLERLQGHGTPHVPGLREDLRRGHTHAPLHVRPVDGHRVRGHSDGRNRDGQSRSRPRPRHIRHLAVNAMFREMGYRFPHPEDAYTITDNRYLNTLLQQCYHGTACHFTITPEITAYPAVGISNQIVFPNGMPAQILKHTGFNATDVAVLKVDGQNMPTVPLADRPSTFSRGRS